MGLIPLVGLAISAASGAMQYDASRKQADAQKRQGAAQQESIAAQQRAEGVREQSMKLDAMRRRREVIRKSIQARSQATATAVNQGAAGGSGLAGGLAEIAGQTNTNILGIDQGLQAGEGIFQANQDKFAADSAGVAAGSAANAAGSQATMYGNLFSLGGAVVKNAGVISRVGSNLFDSHPTANGVASTYTKGA